MRVPRRTDLATPLLILVLCVLMSLTGAFLSTKSPEEYRPGWAAVSGVLAVFVFLTALQVVPEGRRASSGLRLSLFPILCFCSCSVMTPVFQGARSALPTTQCHSNIKQLAIAVQIYASDADERMPPYPTWRTAVSPYAKDGMVQPSACPEARTKWTYAMNLNLGSVDSTRVLEAEATVLLFEVESEIPDAYGRQRRIVRRHSGASFVALLDGMTKKVRLEEEGSLNWLPRFEK